MANKITKFFKDVEEEMKKVSWLNRRDWVRYTWIVIVISTAVALYLWACDLLFAGLLRLIVT